MTTLDDSGIYKITIGEYFYIGQSRELRKRRLHHLGRLRAGMHANPHMQHVFNKYNSFSFSIIEHCDPKDLGVMEHEHVSKHLDDPKCLNMQEVRPDGRYHLSEETRAKIRVGNIGKVMSDEAKRKISEQHKGKTLSKEHRRKLSDAKKGRRNPNYGKQRSGKTRKAIKSAVTQTLGKSCVLMSPSGETHRFSSISDAAKFMGFSKSSHLTRYLNGAMTWPQTDQSKLNGWTGYYG